MEICLKYNAIHDFSELLRTVSNPTDVAQFLSHTGKTYLKKLTRMGL